MELNAEAIFGKQIVEILNILGFETWQEVCLSTGLGDSCIDIVARFNNIYLAFELKLRLNDTVLMQACRNKSYVDYTIVLIPYGNRNNISQVKEYYARSFGIGIYVIDPSQLLNSIQDILKRFTIRDILKEISGCNNRKHIWLQGLLCHNCFKRTIKKSKKVIDRRFNIETYLFKEQKDCVAGSTQDFEKTTPFRRSCAKVRTYLLEHPGMSRKAVWEAIGNQLHWKNYYTMCNSFNVWGNKLECMKDIVFNSIQDKNGRD